MAAPALVIGTRFGIGMRDERWLEHRLSLMSAITVPTLANQTDRDFRWVLFIDAGMPARIREALDRAVAPLAGRVSYDLGGFYSSDVLADVAERHGAAGYGLTARIDDDDAWQPSTVERVRAFAERWLASNGGRRGVGFTYERGIEWVMYDMLDIGTLIKGNRVVRPAAMRDYRLPFLGVSVFVLAADDQGVTAISAGHSSMEKLLGERGFDIEVIATDEPMWLYCRHKQTMSSMQKSRGAVLDLDVGDAAALFGLDEKRLRRYLAGAGDIGYVAHKHAFYRRRLTARAIANIDEQLSDGALEEESAATLRARRAALDAELEVLTHSVIGDPSEATNRGLANPAP
jgi:Putative rhamnosyl transferase